MSGTTVRARLEHAFYARPAEHVARALLGVHIVSNVDGVLVVGRIVETEAYIGPHDPASHAAKRIGRTTRNGSMYGEPGTTYVYRLYGHWCMNVVSDAAGYPAAVLLRAIEPVSGIDAMRARRWADRAPRADHHLGRGPGNLTRALGVTGALDSHRLDSPPLWLEPGEPPDLNRIAVSPRIGVTRAVDWPLRFYLCGNPHVSGR